MRQALLSCSWIGASRGQIDEMKETQSAILRINAGLSSYEKECALLGDDFRKVFRQRAREVKMMKALGLDFATDSTKPGANDRQGTMTGNDADDGASDKEEGDEKATRLEMMRATTSFLNEGRPA
jgi:capsid protein